MLNLFPFDGLLSQDYLIIRKINYFVMPFITNRMTIIITVGTAAVLFFVKPFKKSPKSLTSRIAQGKE